MTVELFSYFPTVIYKQTAPEFIPAVSAAAQKAAADVKLDNDLYPIRHSASMLDDSTLKDFAEYVGLAAFEALRGQGYNMEPFEVFFTDMWAQEHHRHSLMEQHVHGFGAQIVGFYFINAPRDCSRAVFHDPRPAKTQINLPELDAAVATAASIMINFKPEPGLLLFSNAYVPHSLTRHASNESLLLVHFNIAVKDNPDFCKLSLPEVV